MKQRLLIILAFIYLLWAANGMAQYQKVNSNGLDIYYRVFGEGTPILILGGGLGDNSNRYISLCELLSQDFQCVLIDQRGTGKSTPEVYDSTTISISLTLNDFEVLRNQLGLKEWAGLGFSYGGFLASLYVNKYATSVSHLILLESMGLNTNMFAYFRDNINSKLLPSDLEVSEYWRDSTRTAKDPHHALVERIRSWMPGYFYDRKKSLIVSEAMQDSDFNFEIGEWIWGDIIKKDLNLSKVNSGFKNPVLILHGRQDPVGESIPQELSRYYKNSKLTLLKKLDIIRG